MMKNNNEIKKEVNECTSRAVCSIAPNIAALQELIISVLINSSHYILALEKLGGINNNVKEVIINDFANLVSINEFEDKQLYEMLRSSYYLFENVKQTYIQYCKQADKAYVEVDLPFDFNKNTTLAQSVSLGEKLLNKSSAEPKHKYLADIMVALIKSICTNLSMLKSYGGHDDMQYLLVIKSLSILNDTCRHSVILDHIKKLSQHDYKLKVEISKLLFKKFGEISKVSVSNSTRAGKAILVSGDNLLSLEKILELTKNMDIDVYTHSNLNIAHALPKFKSYPNLYGNFGFGDNSSIYDFATFPGAVLISGGIKNTSEYLYRGKIYSDDYIEHKGITKIENDDYSPLIDAAIESKGFSKGHIKPETVLGFDMKNIQSDFEQLARKIDNNDIKHLYIAISKCYSALQREYFNELFSLLKSDEYALSFSQNLMRKNVLSLNLAGYVPLIAEVLDKLFEHVHPSEKIVFIFTACDVASISSIVKLKEHGINNIYMSACQPNILNPAVFDRFRNEYGIKITSTPKDDLYKIRKNKPAH